MKAQLLVITLLFTSSHLLQCNSQVRVHNDVLFEKSISSYLIDGTELTCFSYRVSNKGNEAIWLWLEKEKNLTLSDSIIISRYFLQKKGENDGCLLQIAMDYNVETYIPVVFNGFLKRIMPNNEFYIQVISFNGISGYEEQSISNFLEDLVVLYPQSSVSYFVPLIDKMNQIFLYKQDIITFHKDMILSPR